jgi:putative FmdB family regulatory protein
MPIYEYECKKCQCRFDLKQSYSADGKTRCASCGGEARRVFSPVPIFLKGSGFYVTDKGGPGKKAAGSKTGASDSIPSAAEDSKGAFL